MDNQHDAAADPLLFRYGLPLSRALRHLADPDLWRRWRFAAPTDRDVDDLVVRWGAADPEPWDWETAQRKRRAAAATLANEARRSAGRALEERLWRRLASGELVAWGRRGSVADPFVQIEADTWRHLRCTDWNAGQVEGPGVVFHDVRAFDPAGLPLAVAARALAPLAMVDECDALEHAGYIGAPFVLLHLFDAPPPPSPCVPENYDRLAAMLDTMRARLVAQLSADGLRASGVFLADGPAAKRQRIGAHAWGDPERYRVEWEASRCEWSPDHRPLGSCDTAEHRHVIDVRVFTSAASHAESAPVSIEAPDTPSPGAPSARPRGAAPGHHPANDSERRRPAIRQAMELVEAGTHTLRRALLHVLKVPDRSKPDDFIRPYREQIRREHPDWYARHGNSKRDA